MKSLPFFIPAAWKRYPFWAEPPRIGHCREYPPPPPGYRLPCKFDLDESDRKSSQGNASARKPWPNGVASRPKSSTCVYLRLRLSRALYSCFQKDCLTNREIKLTQHYVAGYYGWWWWFLRLLEWTTWWKETAQTHVFVLSRGLLLNHIEPQLIKTKLLLSIMPIGIVPYTFTLLWDSLCRNTCIPCCPKFTPK